MNERIRDLALQSGFVFWQDEPWKAKDSEIDWSTNYDKEFQKFTELLITECINTILDCSIQYCTRAQIAKEIQEHFDVDK